MNPQLDLLPASLQPPESNLSDINIQI